MTIIQVAKGRTMRFAFVFLMLAAASSCTQPFEWPEADTMVSGVHVINPVDGTVMRDRMLVLGAGEVLAVVDSTLDRLPERILHIDGNGAYVTPGLWDSHVHALGNVETALDRALPAFIAHGITHVRDMGSNFDRLKEVRKVLAAEPGRWSPRIIASGPLLVEQELRWYGDLQRVIGGEGISEPAISELVAGGVDFLKAYSGLSESSYATLMSEAARHGLSVDGHVPYSVGIVGVVEAGQRSIEHLDLSSFLTCRGGPQGPYGNFLALQFAQELDDYYRLAGKFWSEAGWPDCGPALDIFAARGGALTPTLSMEVRDRSRVSSSALSRLDPDSRQWCEQGLEALDKVDTEILSGYYGALFGALLDIEKRGVVILAGTDTPNHCIAPGSSLAGELELLLEAGLSPLTVLQSTTVNPRRVFGLEDNGLGPGQQADFVLFGSNPLDDSTTYRTPVGVYSQGRWLDADLLAELRGNPNDPQER